MGCPAQCRACCCNRFCGICLCGYVSVWLIGLPLAFFSTLGATPGKWQPGNDLRIAAQSEIESKRWDSVSEIFASADEFWSRESALLVGDSDGVLWSEERDFGLSKRVSIASQTKFITGLTIYRVLQRLNATAAADNWTEPALTLDSRPADVFYWFWPQTGARSRIRLHHLLSFTSGYHANFVSGAGCARPGFGSLGEALSRMIGRGTNADMGIQTWIQCVEMIAAAEVEPYVHNAEPGTRVSYNPQHLAVACAMVLQALGRPVTLGSWSDLVEQELFLPVGVTAGVEWGSFNDDTVPDVSAGLMMSGSEMQKVAHALLSGALLEAGWADQFHSPSRMERVAQADDWYGGGLAVGLWHYCQTSWRPCDAIVSSAKEDRKRYTWQSAQAVCADETQQIRHSLGIWGFYVWLDLDRGFYGVYATYKNMWDAFYADLAITAAASFLWTLGVAGLAWWARRRRKRGPDATPAAKADGDGVAEADDDAAELGSDATPGTVVYNSAAASGAGER